MVGEGIARLYPSAGWDDLVAADRLLLPGREVHRIAFGFPFQDVSVSFADTFRATLTSGLLVFVSLVILQTQLIRSASAEVTFLNK